MDSTYIEKLRNKLKSATGIIRRIRDFIPKKHLKSIYFALFESHMTYCISVWGGVGKTHIDKLFVIQKRCIRMLFGDTEKFMNKFSNISGQHISGSELYCKEHTKPLFNEHSILATHNAYKYHISLEFLKILKTRTPSVVFENLNVSHRSGHNLIILGEYSNNFFFQGAKIWNIIIKKISPYMELINMNIASIL